jgi:hypothetical protein
MMHHVEQRHKKYLHTCMPKIFFMQCPYSRGYTHLFPGFSFLRLNRMPADELRMRVVLNERTQCLQRTHLAHPFFYAKTDRS